MIDQSLKKPVKTVILLRIGNQRSGDGVERGGE